MHCLFWLDLPQGLDDSLGLGGDFDFNFDRPEKPKGKGKSKDKGGQAPAHTQYPGSCPSMQTIR